jgi:hypothetical protein
VVDNFETAIKRDKRTKRYIVALSFGRGAKEEDARAKGHEGLDIELVEVRALLDGTHPLAQNESTIFGQEVAPIVPRKCRRCRLSRSYWAQKSNPSPVLPRHPPLADRPNLPIQTETLPGPSAQVILRRD